MIELVHAHPPPSSSKLKEHKAVPITMQDIRRACIKAYRIAIIKAAGILCLNAPFSALGIAVVAGLVTSVVIKEILAITFVVMLVSLLAYMAYTTIKVIVEEEKKIAFYEKILDGKLPDQIENLKSELKNLELSEEEIVTASEMIDVLVKDQKERENIQKAKEIMKLNESCENLSLKKYISSLEAHLFNENTSEELIQYYQNRQTLPGGKIANKLEIVLKEHLAGINREELASKKQDVRGLLLDCVKESLKEAEIEADQNKQAEMLMILNEKCPDPLLKAYISSLKDYLLNEDACDELSKFYRSKQEGPNGELAHNLESSLRQLNVSEKNVRGKLLNLVKRSLEKAVDQ